MAKQKYSDEPFHITIPSKKAITCPYYCSVTKKKKGLKKKMEGKRFVDRTFFWSLLKMTGLKLNQLSSTLVHHVSYFQTILPDHCRITVRISPFSFIQTSLREKHAAL